MHLFGSKKLVVVTAWFTYQTPCAVAAIHHKNSILRSVLLVDLKDQSSVELAIIFFSPTINLVLQPLKNLQGHELYFKLINGTKLHIPAEFQSLTCSDSFLLFF